jgi:hypothetical protein
LFALVKLELCWNREVAYNHWKPNRPIV